MNKISSDQNPSTVLLSVISKCNSSDIDNIPQTSNCAFGANHDCGNPIYGRIQPLWRQAFTHMNSLRKFIPREPSVTTGVVITVTRQRDRVPFGHTSTHILSVIVGFEFWNFAVVSGLGQRFHNRWENSQQISSSF